MLRGCRYLGTVLLAGALATPLAFAKPMPAMQDHDDHDRDEHRVYDRDHKDYHNWDANEDRAYRNYLDEKHETYRDFNHLKRKDQDAYWNWRHSHEQHEEHERDHN